MIQWPSTKPNNTALKKEEKNYRRRSTKNKKPEGVQDTK